MTGGRDWRQWHEQYDDPASALSARLSLVQAHLATAVATVSAGHIKVLSLCAGQGHDVLGVLPSHPRRDDVDAVLVESDQVNADLARDRAARAGLVNIEVRRADAALTSNYMDALPADVLLLCGIFGNVGSDDIRRTAAAAAAMCRPGGTVIWTRHRRPPDLTPQVRAWFANAGFDEVAFEAPPTATLTGVGVYRLRQDLPQASELPPGPLFTFGTA